MTLTATKGRQVEIEKKLRELGLELPNPSQPVGTYIGCVRVGTLLFVGGNIGRINGVLKYAGKVGEAVTLEQAYEMAQNCALNHLATIKAALGDLDQVERIVKVTGYVNVGSGFNDMPKVINGESDLLVKLWGDRGQHTRAAIGVASLGGDAPVETDVIVQIRE
jgi:enamine deaminase RidA (YjgF/YER057c/UK114 family)